jgi:hypothetical protein
MSVNYIPSSRITTNNSQRKTTSYQTSHTRQDDIQTCCPKPAVTDSIHAQTSIPRALAGATDAQHTFQDVAHDAGQQLFPAPHLGDKRLFTKTQLSGRADQDFTPTTIIIICAHNATTTTTQKQENEKKRKQGPQIDWKQRQRLLY